MWSLLTDQSMLMAILSPGETRTERGSEMVKEPEYQENDIITSRQEKKEEEDEKGEQAVMKKAENSEEEEEAGDGT